MIKEDLWTYLKKQSKPIYIYGMGDGAQKIITALNKYGISIKGIYASDNYLRKDTFMGFDVVRRCMVADEDYITLLAFATFNNDMLNDFYNFPTEMYAPDVPVAKTDDRFFDMEYAKKYKSELTFVYNMLADEQSKKVFENVIYFKLTGKVSYLKDITTEIDEVYKNIIKPNKNEVYVDLGAYNGDTISEFIKFGGGGKIIAVEPDLKNYNKMLKRIETENIQNAEALNIGIWDKKETLFFDNCGGRNSKLNKEGKIQIEADCVDNIVGSNIPTILKLDVEGAELKALQGAKNCIEKHKPKIMLSSYHRNEDLFELPIYLKSLNKDYKFYLRHHPYIPAWETNYYVTNV